MAAAGSAVSGGISSVGFESTFDAVPAADVAPVPVSSAGVDAVPHSQQNPEQPPKMIIDVAPQPWVDISAPMSVSVPQRLSGPLAAEDIEPLTVPIPPFGVIGIIGIGSLMGYAGARWLGLRK
jgi:hypothetical protein